MRRGGWSWRRLSDEIAQACAVAVKDIRIYYFTPPMIMFGLMLPFFLFFSFSVRRGGDAVSGISRLVAMNVFFTASSAGPVVIPMERSARTYDRLLAAPMSLASLLVAKTAVGAFFAVAVSCISVVVAIVGLGSQVASPVLLLVAIVLGALASSSFGIAFASVPAESVGNIMMPSTLIRWPLLFVSGVFIPLEQMSPWLLPLSFISPLTYAQDLIALAVHGASYLPVWLDLIALPLFTALFLMVSARLHHRSKVLGY